MSKKVETGLIVVKNNVFTKIRENLFYVFFKKEARLLKQINMIERPRNIINGEIIIPRETKNIIKKY